MSADSIDFEDHDPEELKAQALILALQSRGAEPCSACASVICGHAWVVNVAMGFKNAPRCLPCLARALDRETTEFCHQAVSYIHAHECFTRAWRWAGAAEGQGDSREPDCLMRGSSLQSRELPLGEPEPGASHSAVLWDAGDMSCGDLVLELRLRLKDLSAGAELLVLSRDPGAPHDLPAWCRMTGHTLLRAEHPEYLIRRRSP